MSYRSRIDLGVACVVVLIGLVLGAEALRIDPKSYEAVGPRAVPLFLACAMVMGGLLVGASAWRVRRTRAPAETDADYGFRDSDLARVAAVIGVGLVYLIAFWALGYFGATIIAMALILVVFGNRNPLTIIGGAILAGLVYQVVFMGAMGLLDPRGALVDVRPVTSIFTPE
ncbi:tripartite tricarboxylate transporter TctB family protein [Jannaschia sp. S6380]|uniref:tripartite tricarboxylate transporter TctB family protein n=1 Tax=Jannaschia sp. S6380 TaxID=2926408 RepID=UPI001FF23797|nr:tripartite tricarboxylate transporter TctB family protein [Jannaschia sp. S6380]